LVGRPTGSLARLRSLGRLVELRRSDFSYADAGFTPPALADPALRRR
jgi:hypothetical protein